jgi:hypothetical protein
MIALAGHGKDSQLVQPSIIPELQIGDRIKDKDEFIGEITSINPRCITARSDESIKSYNLEELKDPNFIELCALPTSEPLSAELQFLLEQRDRLINSGASPQGVWLSVGQVYKKDFRQVVWKSAKNQKWLGGNKSRYIGKENSDEHLSAIAQHKAGQELRKVERKLKKLQVES